MQSPARVELALYEPDIAPNVGTLMRLGACLDIAVHVIEPCGFPFSRRALKRTLMDYEPHVTLHHHADWAAFEAMRQSRGQRLVLMTTKASTPHLDVAYQANDILMAGSESVGVPEHVHTAADVRVRIPMTPDVRSVNVATASAILIGEAMRQTGAFSPLA